MKVVKLIEKQEKQQKLGYSAWQKKPETEEYMDLAFGHHRAAKVEEDIQTELLAWRMCAIYKLGKDGRMRFKRWNQKALTRCRKRFLEASATKEK